MAWWGSELGHVCLSAQQRMVCAMHTHTLVLTYVMAGLRTQP